MFFPVVGGDYRSAGIRRRSADSAIYRVRKTLFCGGNDDDTGRCDRGIHLDGFADTIDAVSSYKDREKKLEILKDPHTGAFAVIGLCAYFLITAALWSEVNLKTLSLAVWMYPISRALSGLSVVSFRSAKSSGLLRTFQERADRKRTRIVLSIWLMSLAAGAIYIFRVQGAIIVTAALLVFFYYYKMSFKQFGGITGDLAGYFLQICELVMLTVVAFLGGIC